MVLRGAEPRFCLSNFKVNCARCSSLLQLTLPVHPALPQAFVSVSKYTSRGEQLINTSIGVRCAAGRGLLSCCGAVVRLLRHHLGAILQLDTFIVPLEYF
jgi:hypothetical protein